MYIVIECIKTATVDDIIKAIKEIEGTCPICEKIEARPKIESAPVLA